MATVNFWTQARSCRTRINVGQWFSWVKKAKDGIRQGWLAYTRYNRLCKLSDEALRKRGLQRDQIGRHSFFRDDL